MAAVFLVLLVLAWLALCLRAAARARDTDVIGSTDSFRRGLEVIGPNHHSDFVKTYGRLAPVEAITSPEHAASPAGGDGIQGTGFLGTHSPKPLRVRHAQLAVFLALAAGALVTLGAVLLGGGWELHLAFDAALALYVSWLFEDQHRRAVERKRKVTRLPRRSHSSQDLRIAAGDR